MSVGTRRRVAAHDGAVALTDRRATAARARRPAVSASGPGTRIGPPDTVQTPFAAGAGAALWSAALGLAVTTAAVLATWAVGGVAGPRSALVIGAQAWLLGHGTDLRMAHGSLTLVPLGLTLLFGGLLARSGVWAGRAAMVRTLREAAATTAWLAGVYAAVAVGVSLGATSPVVTPAPASALVGAAVLAVVSGGWGVLYGSGLLGTALAGLPTEVRLAGRAALTGVATLLAGGALTLLAALLWHAQDAAHVYSALGADLVGSVELVVLSAVYVPVGAVWAMTYCLGPGFAVGAGTLVAPSGTTLGDLPSFPLLAALPGEGPARGVGFAALAVPLAAGVVIGLVVARRSPWPAGRTAWVAAVGGALTGGLAGVLALLARGGLTSGRMASLGPQPLVVAAWSALELGVLGALVAGEYRHRVLVRAERRSSPRVIDLTESAVRVLDPGEVARAADVTDAEPAPAQGVGDPAEGEDIGDR